MLVSFFFSTVASVPETYLMAQKESKRFTLISLATLAVNLSLNIYFVAFAQTGVVGILYASIISRFLNTSYLTFLTIPRTGLGFDLTKLKSILKFSIPLIPAEIGLFIFAFSDRFFLSHLSDLESVGLYSLGYKFAFMISLLIVQPFMQIWQQEMYEINNRDGAAEIFGRMYTYLFGIVAGTALLMSIFIKDVIEIISAPDFHGAWKIVPVIAFAYIFRATYLYFQMGMLFKSKTKGLSYVTLIGASFTIVLNIILVPQYGAMGAALATLGSYFILAVITYAVSQRLYKIQFELINLLKITLLTVSILLLYWQVEIDSNVLSLLVRSTSIPFLILLVWTLGILNPIEKQKIKQLIGIKIC
jgi:O-antigen/teichoic acid export membrane protein